MRLICGYMQLDGQPAREARLPPMVAHLDGSGLPPFIASRVDGPAALAVLDFSRPEASPISLPECPGGMLAADIRLDDSPGLTAALALQPDAEDALLLAALETAGASCLARVLGDFAFGWWDRTKRTLTCGRDIFGLRPLAYAYRPGEFFAFASFPTALCAAGFAADTLNDTALAREIVTTSKSEETPFAQIKRLPPGHYLEVSSERLVLKRYFQFDRTSIGSFRGTPDQAARELRSHIERAVVCRLPEGEVGAHLSGGMDSSAIAILAARALSRDGRQLHTYSFFDRPRNNFPLEDESSFVRSVIEQESNLDVTPIAAPQRLAGHWGSVAADKVVALAPDLHENAAAAKARSQSVSIILTGWGGDEAASFNGRGVLLDLFRRGRWRRLSREISALARARGLPKGRTFRGEVFWPFVPRRLRQWRARIGKRRTPLGDLLLATLSAPVAATT